MDKFPKLKICLLCIKFVLFALLLISNKTAAQDTTQQQGLEQIKPKSLKEIIEELAAVQGSLIKGAKITPNTDDDSVTINTCGCHDPKKVMESIQNHLTSKDPGVIYSISRQKNMIIIKKNK